MGTWVIFTFSYYWNMLQRIGIDSTWWAKHGFLFLAGNLLLSIYNLKLVTRAPICNCGVSPIKQTTRLPNHRQCRFSQEYSKFHQPSVYHWRISINVWTLSHVSPKLLGWSNCGPVDESGIGQDLDQEYQEWLSFPISFMNWSAGF